MRPHSRQPSRLPHLWDSPGRNTRVGCHFLLQCMKVKSESEAAQSCPTLSDPMDCSLWSSSHGIFQARVLRWVAIAFSYPYSTNDKTSRLMEKRFSTVRDTQRGSQSYMEKRRGRREIEVTSRRRGGIKRGERNLASNHFPTCSPQSGSLRDVHRVTQRREERGRR